MIITSSPSRRTQRAAVKGPYCLRFQCAKSIFLLIIKQTFVVGRASYVSVKPLGQYVDLVYLLYAGSWTARTWWSAGVTLSKKGRHAPWFAFPQLYWIIVHLFI